MHCVATTEHSGDISLQLRELEEELGDDKCEVPQLGVDVILLRLLRVLTCSLGRLPLLSSLSCWRGRVLVLGGGGVLVSVVPGHLAALLVLLLALVVFMLVLVFHLMVMRLRVEAWMFLRFLVIFLRLAVVALFFYGVWKIIWLIPLKGDPILLGDVLVLRLRRLGVVFGEKFIHQILKIKLVPSGRRDTSCPAYYCYC